MEIASCKEERDGFALLLSDVRLKLRKVRKAEKKARNKHLHSKAAKAFRQNPLKAGKEILDPVFNQRLTVEKEVLNSHREKTMKDPFFGIPLGDLEGLPPATEVDLLILQCRRGVQILRSESPTKNKEKWFITRHQPDSVQGVQML